MTQIIDLLLFVILSIAGFVMAFIALVDGILSSAMTYSGVPPLSQIIILFAMVFWLIAVAVRVLGPIFSVLITLLLILLFVHRVFPGLEPPPPPAHALAFVQSYL